MPTPARPDVAGYLLSVNGEYMKARTACVEVTGGKVCAYPMTNADGSYARRTEVTLGAFPEEDGYEVTWEGTDSAVGTIATLRMIRDQEVTLVMAPYAVPPTPTPAPLPTVSLTPEANGSGSGSARLWERGTEGTGNGQFSRPTAIAASQTGRVYVADTGNNRVQVFSSSSGLFLGEWGTEGTGEGQFRGPNGVAVDGSAFVYVLDGGNHRVQKSNGSGTWFWESGLQGQTNSSVEAGGQRRGPLVPQVPAVPRPERPGPAGIFGAGA